LDGDKLQGQHQALCDGVEPGVQIICGTHNKKLGMQYHILRSVPAWGVSVTQWALQIGTKDS